MMHNYSRREPREYANRDVIAFMAIMSLLNRHSESTRLPRP